ncbi:hypothetical protein ACBJ59_61110 [Nonomuraea sp. MTCD27]|uniref:hypothetical protein n=1 Tax=Nonomuraea sp. MTCD27 TaxID=1676747 RepID=UPI0035C0F43D
MTRTTLMARRTLLSAMAAAGTTGAGIADEVGVSKQFMSLLTRGRRRCNPTIASAIAAELQAPVQVLFTSENVSDSSDNRTEVSVLEVIDEDPVLEFDDVAARFNIKPKTLRHLRAVGEGPPFFKVGHRLKIRRSTADAWHKEKFEHSSVE